MDDRMQGYKVTSAAKLRAVEKKYRKFYDNEIIPFAQRTPFVEVAEVVFPDHDGEWKHPLHFYITKHLTTTGIQTVCKKIKKYLEEQRRK